MWHSIYLWRIKRVLKLCKVPKYFEDDWRSASMPKMDQIIWAMNRVLLLFFRTKIKPVSLTIKKNLFYKVLKEKFSTFAFNETFVWNGSDFIYSKLWMRTCWELTDTVFSLKKIGRAAGGYSIFLKNNHIFINFSKTPKIFSSKHKVFLNKNHRNN